MKPDEHLQQDLAGETGAVERGKAAPALSPEDVGRDSRRPKRNDILLHVAAISICLTAAALLVAASLWRTSRPRPPRPPGSLQRRHVDYFGRSFVKGWPGIESASRAEVGEAIAAAKDPLRAACGGGGFSEGECWTIDDELALQRFLDAMREKADSPWERFPGDVHRPLDAHALWRAAKEARRLFLDDGGKLRFHDNLLLAWAMKESAWNACASAYGSTRGKSTAVGLLMITRTTYDRFAQKGLLGKKLVARCDTRWDERLLSDPVLNMTAALFILQNGPGGTLKEKLGYYYNPGNPAAGKRYAEKVLAGKAFLDRAVSGKKIPGMSPALMRKLALAVDKAVR